MTRGRTHPSTVERGGRTGWLPGLLILLGLVALLATLVIALAGPERPEHDPMPPSRSPTSMLESQTPAWTRHQDLR
ncbi:MAG: hypothetical protein R3F30_04050 [Planctomycetota bacterium]